MSAEDSGDRISATVDADGRRYLVVADAIQRGWRAEVDGEPADLRAADHAVVAVEVPVGTHEIDLVYDPPGRRRGAWIALVSAVALAALALTAVFRRPSFGRVGGAGRRSRGRSDDGSRPLCPLTQASFIDIDPRIGTQELSVLAVAMASGVVLLLRPLARVLSFSRRRSRSWRRARPRQPLAMQNSLPSGSARVTQ